MASLPWCVQIVPACELPEDAVQAGAKLAIINLQDTQHDEVICCYCVPCPTSSERYVCVLTTRSIALTAQTRLT
jgi:hypothetical protein